MRREDRKKEGGTVGMRKEDWKMEGGTIGMRKKPGRRQEVQ